MSIRNAAREWVTGSRDVYVKDLTAMTHEQLMDGRGGRVPYDFTYEVAVVNRRVAKRLRGEDPGDWPYDGWITAPEEFRNKEAITREFLAATDEIVSAFDSMNDEQVMGDVATSEGTKPVLDMMQFAAMHTMYHDGQLNQLQAQAGDMEVHWM